MFSMNFWIFLDSVAVPIYFIENSLARPRHSIIYSPQPRTQVAKEVVHTESRTRAQDKGNLCEVGSREGVTTYMYIYLSTPKIDGLNHNQALMSAMGTARTKMSMRTKVKTNW